MFVLACTLMHQVVVYLSIPHTHTHLLQEKHNSLEHFSMVYLQFIIVITPLNLLITEKEEEFQDSDV